VLENIFSHTGLTSIARETPFAEHMCDYSKACVSLMVEAGACRNLVDEQSRNGVICILAAPQAQWRKGLGGAADVQFESAETCPHSDATTQLDPLQHAALQLPSNCYHKLLNIESAAPR
jgi:hypothetical protein